jgi:hypothetical protein
MKPDGGIVEACCLADGQCGMQISTVGACIEARSLESAVGSLEAPPLADAARPWEPHASNAGRSVRLVVLGRFEQRARRNAYGACS